MVTAECPVRVIKGSKGCNLIRVATVNRTERELYLIFSGMTPIQARGSPGHKEVPKPGFGGRPERPTFAPAPLARVKAPAQPGRTAPTWAAWARFMGRRGCRRTNRELAEAQSGRPQRNHPFSPGRGSDRGGL